MRFRYLIFLVCSLSIILSCSKKIKPDKKAKEIPYTLNDETVINIGFEFNKTAITDQLGLLMDESFEENFDFPEYEVKAKFNRLGDLMLDVQDRDVLIVLSLGIEVEKETFITTLKAAGDVELSFAVNFDISEDWDVKTKTTFIDHLWLTPPTLNTGVGSVSLEGYTNQIFAELEPLLEQELDLILSEQVDLKSNIEELTKTLTEPKQLSEDYGGWFYFEPISSSMSGFENKQNSIVGNISLVTKTIVQSGIPKGQISSQVPSFSWDENISKKSIFRINTFVQYEHLEDELKKEVVGQMFTAKGRSITIDEIEVFGKNQKIVVESKVHGSLNGTVIIEGRPKYDRLNKRIYVDNIDVKVKSSKLTHRALAWLLKGKIRKELEEVMVFPLKNLDNEIQDAINEITKEYADLYNLDFRINVEELDIGHIAALENALSAQFLIDNRIYIYFKDLSLFVE